MFDVDSNCTKALGVFQERWTISGTIPKRGQSYSSVKHRLCFVL